MVPKQQQLVYELPLEPGGLDEVDSGLGGEGADSPTLSTPDSSSKVLLDQTLDILAKSRQQRRRTPSYPKKSKKEKRQRSQQNRKKSVEPTDSETKVEEKISR